MPKDISIIIPIYNDALTIGGTIDSLLNFFIAENLDGELVIVSDGGKEDGIQVVKEKMRGSPAIRLVDRKENRGKGFSVREGMGKAAGKIIFYTDADLPYGTEAIKQMYNKLALSEADLILANRNLLGSEGMSKSSLARKLTHIIYSIFVGSLVFEFSDSLAGLKGMTRETAATILPHLTIDRFSFDVEFILLAKKLGLRIAELPVKMRESGKSNLKILFDGPVMIKDVLKIVWRDRLGFYNVKRKK